MLYLHMRAILERYMVLMRVEGDKQAVTILRGSFLKRAFIWNCDLFGLLLVYFQLFQHDTIRTSRSRQNEMRMAAAQLLFKYYVSPRHATAAYDVDELMADMERLNLYATGAAGVPNPSPTPRMPTAEQQMRHTEHMDRTCELVKLISRKPFF